MRRSGLHRSGLGTVPAALVALAVLAIVAGGAAAAAQRDPMHAAPSRAAAVDADATAPPPPPPLVARHLLVVGGRRFVVEGASRRAVGEHLGGARIESIEDSAVVVSRGGVLQRLPLFAGVVKQPSREAPPTAAERSASAARRRAATPSSGLQGLSP